MRLCRTPFLVAALCLPLWVEAQTAPPPAPEQPDNKADAPAKPEPTPKDPDLKSARDAIRRAGGGAGARGGGGFGGYGIVQAPNPGARDALRGWLDSRQPTEKAAWIGISVSPAPAVLRHQLKLHEGTGLVVDFVQPKSPAEEAGVKQYDLMDKLDDQLLINAEQFAVLVRTFKPGEEVKLSLFREGKRQTIQVKLAEHEVPRLGDMMQFQEFTVPHAVVPEVSPPARVPMGAGGAAGSWFGADRAENSLTWLDGKQALTITTKDGHATVSALDKPSGKVLYTYPIDTDEQRAALPKEIRERLARLKFPPGGKFAELRFDSSDSKDPTSTEEAPAPPAAR